MTSIDPEKIYQAIRMANSDSEIERRAAVSWILEHGEVCRPFLADQVRTGSCPSMEICMRLLAAIGGKGVVEALEAALLRGNEAESFYAAVALGEAGEDGKVVLQSHRRHPVAEIRTAVAHVLAGIDGRPTDG